MFNMFLIFYIVLLVFLLVYLFKGVKDKDNKNWYTFFGLSIASILSCVISFFYKAFHDTYFYLDSIVVLFYSVVAVLIYVLVFVLGIILKITQTRNLKKKNIQMKNYVFKKKRLLISLITAVLATVLFCITDFVVYDIKETHEKERYDSVKEEKLEMMVNYLNDKYDTQFTVEDNVFYREYDHYSIEITSEKNEDFYIGSFKNGEELITVSVNENDFVSDNAQVEEIGYLIRDYYSDIIGEDIEYVSFKGESDFYQDTPINDILQVQFNDIINKNNIGDFIEKLLDSDVEIIFYVKDTKDKNTLIKKMINKLSYLEQKNTVKGITIYFIDSKEEVIVENNEIALQGDYRYDEIHYDYYASRMFGAVIVPNSLEFSQSFENENNFVTIAFSNTKSSQIDKYEDKNVDTINNWSVYSFDK